LTTSSGWPEVVRPDPGRGALPRQLPQEPEQHEVRTIETEAAVPLDAIYKAFHMPAKTDNDYFAADLMTDLLGGASRRGSTNGS
jgi:predicted Zn-dependent peptidase